jgi:hypothetical protein
MHGGGRRASLQDCMWRVPVAGYTPHACILLRAIGVAALEDAAGAMEEEDGD